MKDLFPFGSDLANPKFTEHALNVMNAIDLAVQNLDNPDVLIPKLKALGRAHAMFDLTETEFGVRFSKFPGLSFAETFPFAQTPHYGPLLFILYVNDLPNCLSNAQFRMYADDTHLTFDSNDIIRLERGLNEDLAEVNEWLIANKLTLNKSKTEFMLIRSRQRISTFDLTPSFTIENTLTKQVSSTKSLGIYIDENPSWNVHIDNISKKIASGIGMFKKK